MRNTYQPPKRSDYFREYLTLLSVKGRFRRSYSVRSTDQGRRIKNIVTLWLLYHILYWIYSYWKCINNFFSSIVLLMGVYFIFRCLSKDHQCCPRSCSRLVLSRCSVSAKSFVKRGLKRCLALGSLAMLVLPFSRNSAAVTSFAYDKGNIFH